MEFEECMKIGTGLTELTEDRTLTLKKNHLLQHKIFFSDTPSEKKIKPVIIKQAVPQG